MILVAIFMMLAGAVIRYAGLSFVSFDMQGFLIPWYDKIVSGGFASLREPFSNYTPPYLYLLWLSTLTRAILPKVAAIKLISIAFDFCSAFLVYKILSLKYAQGTTPLLGAGAFLLLPTVLLNSAFWGQADATYTFFLLACVYFLMKDQPLPALIFWGLSLSFKAQAIFLAPLLLLLTLQKRIPWFYFAIVPIVYALMMIPAALTGHSFLDLMLVYLNQADTYRGLSMHGPNLYVFIPNSLYTPGLVIGILITVAAISAWIAVYARRVKEFTPEIILLCALASVAIVPFFMPKMHDRYFYLADVLSFVAAFYFPRLWFLAVGYQIVSGLAYSIFLIPSIAPMKKHIPDLILNTAALVNTAVMALLLWMQARLIPRKS